MVKRSILLVLLFAASAAFAQVPFTSYGMITLPPGPPGPPGSGGGSVGGRLAPVVSGSMVDGADVTGATTIAYAPVIGSKVPVVDGSGVLQWMTFTANSGDALGKTLALGSSWAADSLHDVYMAWNGGTPALCTGAWASGAPHVADAMFDGYKVNSASFTCRTGNAATITCQANQCTYLGTIQIDPTAGQVSCLYSRSLPARCGIWNQYNRKLMTLQAGDNWCTTPGCVYQISSTLGCVLGNCANSVTVLQGRPDDSITVDILYNRRVKHLSGGSATLAAHYFGVGWNTTSAVSGFWGGSNVEFYDGWTNSRIYAGTHRATYTAPPFQGSVVATALEYCPSYGGCEAWNIPGNFVMQVSYRR